MFVHGVEVGEGVADRCGGHVAELVAQDEVGELLVGLLEFGLHWMA